MQINVSQLLREPIGATREYRIDEAAETSGENRGRTLRGDCTLLRTQRSILARCSLSTTVELTCCRCLSAFHHPVTLKFEEEYLPTVDVVSGVPLPRPDDPGDFTIDEHHIIDLGEAIRQYTLLAVPMKPLCRKECAGICPDCGKNLNNGKCDCPTEVIDPRWSELTKLL
jgi:uncharacterized protein